MCCLARPDRVIALAYRLCRFQSSRVLCPTSATTRRPPYRAILWDNDGVLVDTERLYHRATREILAEVGIDVTETLYREHFLITSGGITELGAGYGLGDSQVVELRRRRDARYEDYLATAPLVIDGVEPVLERLRASFTMGIVTGSRRHHFELMHRRTGLLRYFDFSLTQGDYDRSKPAPDPYLAGIARTGFAAADCVAVEDSPRGLVAARAAGIDCWVVSTPLSRGSDFSSATRMVDSVSDLGGLLSTRASVNPHGRDHAYPLEPRSAVR